ncbi:MAG: hypothetical protein H7831_00750 [Magnetococcus sp. WYHC-3]
MDMPAMELLRGLLGWCVLLLVLGPTIALIQRGVREGVRQMRRTWRLLMVGSFRPGHPRGAMRPSEESTALWLAARD